MRRTYGRLTNEDGTQTWVPVVTDSAGNDDLVWVVTLAQTLKLELGESPFFGNYGIPAQRSVIQQIFPDFYISQTQSQFSQYFAALQIAKLGGSTPTYKLNVTTHKGTQLDGPIPT